MTHGDFSCGVAQPVYPMVRGIHQHAVTAKDGNRCPKSQPPQRLWGRSRRPARQLRGNLGVASIVFMVVAAAAPLGVIGGVVPLGLARATAQVPATFWCPR